MRIPVIPITHSGVMPITDSTSRNQTRASGCAARTRSKDSSPKPNAERFMTRQELEHIIRAAADVTSEKELIIIGSQAILG